MVKRIRIIRDTILNDGYVLKKDRLLYVKKIQANGIWVIKLDGAEYLIDRDSFTFENPDGEE